MRPSKPSKITSDAGKTKFMYSSAFQYPSREEKPLGTLPSRSSVKKSYNKDSVGQNKSAPRHLLALLLYCRPEKHKYQSMTCIKMIKKLLLSSLQLTIIYQPAVHGKELGLCSTTSLSIASLSIQFFICLAATFRGMLCITS